MLPCNTPMNNVVHISGTQSDAGLGSFRYTNGATSGTVENPNVGGRVLSGVNGMINYG
jgi:hypothetical protein